MKFRTIICYIPSISTSLCTVYIERTKKSGLSAG